MLPYLLLTLALGFALIAIGTGPSVSRWGHDRRRLLRRLEDLRRLRQGWPGL